MAALSYVSTRGNSPAVALNHAIATGLAPDGGLYVPTSLPTLDGADFDANGTLAATATQLLTPFFEGDPLAKELASICRDAFTFDAPLHPLPYANAHVLELFHGPTAAFKDFGARFLANCITRLAFEQPKTILVATSGDTGAAVGAAFHRQAGSRVVILYPDGHVAPRQAHQLGSFGGNVHTLRVAGYFDDCQRIAKALLNDSDLQSRVSMTSANSISLGRLLPQMAYYAHTALSWWRTRQEKPNFIIPTGNLGNALACLWVREVGLPIGDVRFACNANATLPDFFAGNAYRPRRAVATLANAMDIGAPNNFERLQWTFPDTAQLRDQLFADSVDDDTIRATITTHAREHGNVFCPHTATAVHVLDQLRAAGDKRHWITVSTAHPSKFDSIVEPLVGHPVQTPAPLAAMLERPAQAEPIEADEAAIRGWILNHLSEP